MSSPKKRRVLGDRNQNINEIGAPETRRSSRRGVPILIHGDGLSETTTVIPTRNEHQSPFDGYDYDGIISEDLRTPVDSEDEDPDIGLQHPKNSLKEIGSLDGQNLGSPRRNFMSAIGLIGTVSSSNDGSDEGAVIVNTAAAVDSVEGVEGVVEVNAAAVDSVEGEVEVGAAVDSVEGAVEVNAVDSAVESDEIVSETGTPVVKSAVVDDIEGVKLSSTGDTETENFKHDVTVTPENTNDMYPVKDAGTEEMEPIKELQVDSPNGSSSKNEEEELNMEVECDPNNDGTTEDISIGKLRSSVADAEGMALANSYRDQLEKTDEYAMQYITSFHHPVISSFRDLSKSDLSCLFVPSKLKKCFNTLEQSIVYLALIDLLATVNNNPLYGDNCNAKFSKNVPTSVKKILLEFKNIIGSWALSGTDILTQRYKLVLKYLRCLVPMFETAGFDLEFGNILDSIEKEVSRCKMNQEKIKTINSISFTPEIGQDKKNSLTETQDTETKTTLNEIVLDVKIDVKLDESDDDEVSLITENKIFGKPLKASPKTSEARKKAKKSISSVENRKKDNPTVNKKEQKSDKSKVSTLSSNVTKFLTASQPKVVASIFKSLNSPKSTDNGKINKEHVGKSNIKKRVADEKLAQNNNVTKKVKLDEQSSPVSKKENEKTKSIFQTQASSSSNSTPVTANASLSVAEVKKPSINAFALMMNKSRELAQKKVQVDKIKQGTRKLPATIKAQ